MSVRVLREQGPMGLRAVTRATATALGLGSLTYDDVDAVLRSAAERGEVRLLADDYDFRSRIWEAVDA